MDKLIKSLKKSDDFLHDKRRLLVVPALALVFINYNSENYPIRQWIKLGAYTQTLWGRFLDWFGDDSFTLYVYGMNIWLISLYWIVGLLYLMVDIFDWPQSITRHKVQPNVAVDNKRLLSLIGLNLFNQFGVGIPFSVLGYYILQQQGTTPPIRELPSFATIVASFAIFIVVQEIFAYYTHRMFHHRLLYKWTHKWHHEWPAPIAITAMYNHPLDHLIGNILPATIGTSLISAHIFTTWLWLTWASLRTLSDHSGYHMFTFPSPQRHDFHHLKFTECFGVWGPLDYLHGTETKFQKYIGKIKKEK